ncbi:MAG: luciferase family protein [Pseudonocardiaceae bacterium]
MLRRQSAGGFWREPGMNTVANPVSLWWGSRDPASPLVVVFQGGNITRDATDDATEGLFARHLPSGVRYALVHVPPASPGVPGPGCAAFHRWLEDQLAPEVPIVLVGFGSGVAIAGGLVLTEPARFAAAALLYGALPLDKGLPSERGQLAGVPIFLVQGAHDLAAPVELQRWTWNYLVRESGSPLWAQREPTGCQLTARTVSGLAGWIEARLGYMQRNPGQLGAASAGQASWPTLPRGRLPVRHGDPPEVSITTPQQQESQNAPAEIQERLYSRIVQLDGVVTVPSAISVDGSRGFILSPADVRGPGEAFLVPDLGEFAHLHPGYDGSLHLALPMPLARDALAQGWAVAHPLAGLRLPAGAVMIFGPRDGDELETVTGIVRASHAYAASR